MVKLIYLLQDVSVPPTDLQLAAPIMRCRVLIVEDNADYRETLTALLTIYGYHVQSAANGKAGLAGAHAFHPDAILLDLGLPVMHGYEFAACIRSDPTLNSVVIAAITGWGSPSDKAKSAAGRLIEAKRTSGGQRAAVVCHRQQVLEIVPVEVLGAMRHCGSHFAALRLSPSLADPYAEGMNTSKTDSPDFKASMRRHWDAAAPGWDEHSPAIRAWLRSATDAMIAMAGVVEGSRVLDVAAGAGDQTLDLAERVGPSGAVIATDLSPAIVERAQARAVRAGLDHVQCRVADGEDLQVAPASFDAAVCRLGLMFFPDPLQGLREMYRALRPGGGVCTIVFSHPARNPCLTILSATALRHAGLPARDPEEPGSLFSLGRPGRIDALCDAAGFRDVATTSVDAVFHVPSVDDYLVFVRSSASPILQILAGLGEVAAGAAWDDIRQRLSVFETPNGWEGPNELLITAARRP